MTRRGTGCTNDLMTQTATFNRSDGEIQVDDDDDDDEKEDVDRTKNAETDREHSFAFMQLRHQMRDRRGVMTARQVTPVERERGEECLFTLSRIVNFHTKHSNKMQGFCV